MTDLHKIQKGILSQINHAGLGLQSHRSSVQSSLQSQTPTSAAQKLKHEVPQFVMDALQQQKITKFERPKTPIERSKTPQE